MNIIANTLSKGNKIAIIASARYVNVDELLYAEKIFIQWGLVPIRGKYLLEKHNVFSATDKQRLSDLQEAINNTEIKAIFCFRGGYGSVRILEHLDISALKKHPKWIIGYSDITAIHNLLNNNKIASLHGTMPINFQNNTKESLNSLKTFLFNNETNITYNSSPLNKLGSVNAEIVGGNLALLQSLSGTKYDINTDNKILFIEEIDEYLYNIDRMLWTLKLSGKLDNLAALIIGQFTNIKDNEESFGISIEDMVLEKVKEFAYPICFDFPTGHVNDNRAIPLGVNLKLDINNNMVNLRSINY